MSISCFCDDYDPDWYYVARDDFEELNTKRSRRCCSCKSVLRQGDTVLKFVRWRSPLTLIEESIKGDEVNIAPWYMCEVCGGLFFAIEEAGMCCDIRESLADQIKEYRSWAA